LSSFNISCIHLSFCFYNFFLYNFSILIPLRSLFSNSSLRSFIWTLSSCLHRSRCLNSCYLSRSSDWPFDFFNFLLFMLDYCPNLLCRSFCRRLLFSFWLINFLYYCFFWLNLLYWRFLSIFWFHWSLKCFLFMIFFSWDFWFRRWLSRSLIDLILLIYGWFRINYFWLYNGRRSWSFLFLWRIKRTWRSQLIVHHINSTS